MGKSTLKKSVLGLFLLIFCSVGIWAVFNAFENVNAGTVAVIQDPIDGELHIYRKAGLKYQNFGRVTKYEKSYQYDFKEFRTRFNDKGKAYVTGTIRWDMPQNRSDFIKLHEKFGDTGGQEEIENELLRPTMKRAILMSGPMMSSTESAAAKRTDLITYIADQARYGVYDTFTEEIKIKDKITGKTDTKNIVQRRDDKTAPGGFVREEPSDIQKYGINISNFTISEIDYTDKIDKQIEDQRRLEMDIQTAIAETKKAKQQAIKAEEEGKAAAAKAKWKQKKKKAVAVTKAKQRRAVAEQELETAKLERAAKEQQAKGELALRRAKMRGDGALERKLETYQEVQETWAKAFANSKHKLVPDVQLGGEGGGNSGSNFQRMMQIMSVQAAKDLGVNMTPSGDN